jgi:hypothetical protein
MMILRCFLRVIFCRYVSSSPDHQSGPSESDRILTSRCFWTREIINHRDHDDALANQTRVTIRVRLRNTGALHDHVFFRSKMGLFDDAG